MLDLMAVLLVKLVKLLYLPDQYIYCLKIFCFNQNSHSSDRNTRNVNISVVGNVTSERHLVLSLLQVFVLCATMKLTSIEIFRCSF